MSFLDDMRQNRAQAVTRQVAEQQRLIEISRRIIRDEIGLNYRHRLLAILKDEAHKAFVAKGEIDIFRPRHTVRLDHSITECDLETIRKYLENEWQAAFEMFDHEVDGTNRHHERAYYSARGGSYPAFALSVISHHFVPPEDEYSQPYYFDISATVTYSPPIT